jgi:mannose-6-phosphate isomerase-like protein (cupin superfamily)
MNPQQPAESASSVKPAEPVFLLPEEGEAVSDGPEKTVRILADLDTVVATWSRYASGTRGPGPHVHHRHTDAFYVLEGTLVFEFGREPVRVQAEAGTFVAVPSETVHTFWNDGPGEARFLNIHAPGELFADYLRAARDGRPNPGFDTDDPPPDGGRPAGDVVLRSPGEGEALPIGPSRTVLKSTSDDADGTFSLAETSLSPGSPGPPPHFHDGIVDSFFVLEGAPVFEVEGRTTATLPGTYVLAPPGTAHTFSNPGGRPARVLNLMAPAGFERYLRELAAVWIDGPPDPDRMAELGSRHDFHPARAAG